MRRPATLDLEALCAGILPGLSPRGGATMAEAAGVCLADRGHPSGCNITVEGRWNMTLPIRFCSVNAQKRATWNDHERATEEGAYGVAILLLSKIDGYCVIEKSRKGPGFDYWLGKGEEKENTKAKGKVKADQVGRLFQEMLRLEVSGIRTGSEANIAARIKGKITQVKKKASSFPALVAVVEYSRPLARLVPP